MGSTADAEAWWRAARGLDEAPSGPGATVDSQAGTGDIPAVPRSSGTAPERLRPVPADGASEATLLSALCLAVSDCHQLPSLIFQQRSPCPAPTVSLFSDLSSQTPSPARVHKARLRLPQTQVCP